MILAMCSLSARYGARQVQRGKHFMRTVKGAQHAFVKSYAQEVALSHIRVNAIAPGFIQTSMNSHLNDEELESILEEIPLGTVGKTTDVAEWYAFIFQGRLIM